MKTKDDKNRILNSLCSSDPIFSRQLLHVLFHIWKFRLPHQNCGKFWQQCKQSNNSSIYRGGKKRQCMQPIQQREGVWDLWAPNDLLPSRCPFCKERSARNSCKIYSKTTPSFESAWKRRILKCPPEKFIFQFLYIFRCNFYFVYFYFVFITSSKYYLLWNF